MWSMARLGGVLMLGGVCLAAPAMAQQQVIPVQEPAFCQQQDSFVPVAKGFMQGLSQAQETARITPDQYQQLSVWFIAMQNWMIQTDRVRETCEALIQARRAYGF